MKRPDITPRLFEDHDVNRLAESTQEALDTVPLISYKWVRGYVAVGVQGEPMPPIPWPGRLLSNGIESPPDAAMVVRLFRTDAPSEPTILGTAIGAVWTLNFRMEGTQVILFEPYQMDANVSYDMLIQFVAGVGG